MGTTNNKTYETSILKTLSLSLELSQERTDSLRGQRLSSSYDPCLRDYAPGREALCGAVAVVVDTDKEPNA
jgi:hypothetical protein